MPMSAVLRQAALSLTATAALSLCGIAALGSSPPAQAAFSNAASAPAIREEAAAPAPSTGLAMQFTSAGHVLGFTSEGVLIAGRDHLLKVSFIDAAPVAPAAGDDTETSAPATTAAESKGAAALTEVHYRNLWTGIDLRYDGKDGIVRSTWTLAPEANPEAIRLAYNVPVELSDEGTLKLSFATGTMQESAPLAWQEIEGEQKPVQVAFQMHANGELGFSLGDYDPSHPLTIDPTLTWNTFLGGAGTDYGYGIATDTAGNVYVTGYSAVAWAEVPVRAHDFGANDDAFVARLVAATGARTWHTFLGGAGTDRGYKIATDPAGNVYVTGESNAIWGALPPVRAHSGGFDAFVARLSAAGALTWHTFLGGGRASIRATASPPTPPAMSM